MKYVALLFGIFLLLTVSACGFTELKPPDLSLMQAVTIKDVKTGDVTEIPTAGVFCASGRGSSGVAGGGAALKVWWPANADGTKVPDCPGQSQ